MSENQAQSESKKDPAKIEPVPNIRGQMARAFCKGLVVPLLVLVLFAYAPHLLNQQIKESARKEIQGREGLSPSVQAERIAYLEKLDFGEICRECPPGLENLRAGLERQGVCGNFQRLRWGLFFSELLVGLLLAASGAVVVLSRIGRRSRDAFMWSYRVGWNIAIFAALAKLVLLTPLLTYGAFELTVLIANRYYPQLLLAIVLVGLGTLIRGVSILLKKVPLEFNEPMSREVTPTDAPELWAVVRAAAERLQTAPPDHVIIGVQLNFYVTELAVKHGTGRAEGRTLYLSYPLLKQLTTTEVLSVIGHELGHFLGNDTRMTREFFPLRLKVRATMFALAQGAYMGWTSLQLLNFFSWSFGEVEQEESRRRELLADQQAAALTSPEIAARALVKFHVLAAAFNHGLAAAVRQQGQNPMDLPLNAYVREKLLSDEAFWKQLFESKLPHPLDSHPALQVRLTALGQESGIAAAQAVSTEEVRTAFAEWLFERDSLFAEVTKEAGANLDRMRARAQVVDADYKTEAGKELLDRLFPEKSWQTRQSVVWRVVVLAGCLASGFGAAAVLLDGTPVRVVFGLLAFVLGLGGVGTWIRHRHGELRLNADGLCYTGWKRPLRFSEIQNIRGQRSGSRVTLHIRLKESQPPLWKFSVLPFRKKTATFSLAGLNSKSMTVAQAVFQYYTRQEANPPAART